MNEDLQIRIRAANGIIQNIVNNTVIEKKLPEWNQFIERDKTVAYKTMLGIVSELDYELWLQAVKELADVTIM